MVVIAAGLLSLAVAGGLALALLHARGRAVAPAAGLVHAGIALAGVGLLGLAVWRDTPGMAVNTALLLFVLAAIGGVFNGLFRMQGERPPGFMIALHGATAAVALTVLWLAIGAAGR